MFFCIMGDKYCIVGVGGGNGVGLVGVEFGFGVF